MPDNQWLVNFLVDLGILRSDAELVSQLTSVPDEALQLLGRDSDGAVSITRKDVREWYSEKEQKYYYVVTLQDAAGSSSPATTSNWAPPACFAYSEWLLDSQMYQIPLIAARDIYLGLDALIHQHPPNKSWPAITSLSKILCNIADCGNSEAKYRSIRLGNDKFRKTVCAVPGALDVLLFSGFKLLGEMVIFPENTPLGILQAAAARSRRLVEKKGHSGEAKSDGRGDGSDGSVGNGNTDGEGGIVDARNPWGNQHRGPYPQRALDRLYGRHPR